MMMRVSILSAAAFLFTAPLASAQEAAHATCAPSVMASTPIPNPEPRGRRAGERTAVDTLENVNAAARQRPGGGRFMAARQIYVYAPGAIYELYASPSFVSTILLEPGESLNDVAAGDTSRWMVTETQTESETDARTVVMVKPQTVGLRTNIVLVTNKRTYIVEAISRAGSVYSAQVAWCYPQEPGANASGPSIDRLNFSYRVRTVRGRRPAWQPTRVFDDGRRTWIEMPANVVASDLPPLFVITPEGAELVNYRVQGTRYAVDRVFDVAELRLGTRNQTIVRIEREPVRRAPPPPTRGRP